MPQKRAHGLAEALGLVIRVERRRRNWSAEDLAKKLNVTKSAISAWEAGICSPTLGNIVKLAGIFKQTTSVLMDTAERVLAMKEMHDKAAQSAHSGDNPKG